MAGILYTTTSLNSIIYFSFLAHSKHYGALAENRYYPSSACASVSCSRAESYYFV